MLVSLHNLHKWIHTIMINDVYNQSNHPSTTNTIKIKPHCKPRVDTLRYFDWNPAQKM